MWEQLSDRPDVDRLRSYVDTALRERGDDIEFIVLYGSMARGNWSRDSDFDLLIGLRIEDGQRFMDRVFQYEQIAPGPIEPFVYSRSEWEKMWGDLHMTYLEAPTTASRYSTGVRGRACRQSLPAISPRVWSNDFRVAGSGIPSG